MHIGAPAKTIVEVGDQVKIGTLIAEKDGAISANIYSSVSGEVIDISEQPSFKGNVDAIIIKNDFKDQKEPPLYDDEEELSVEEKKDIIDKAGIVGMGGATFPTAVKISPPEEKNIDTLIINGAECEPYSTSDHRVMIEHASELIEGVFILKEILSVDRVYVALESNTHDSADELKRRLDVEDDINIVELETIYPQGDERKLIKRLTNREVRSEEHTSELQSRGHLVCRLLLEKKK